MAIERMERPGGAPVRQASPADGITRLSSPVGVITKVELLTDICCGSDVYCCGDDILLCGNGLSGGDKVDSPAGVITKEVKPT